MSRRNNRTDEQFRERLRNFESDPPVQVWHGISHALLANRRRKRILWASRIAASLALFIAVGMAWLFLREPVDRPLVNMETEGGHAVPAPEQNSIQDETGAQEAENPAKPSDMAHPITPTSDLDRTAQARVAREIRPTPAVQPPAEEAGLTAGQLPSREWLKAVPAIQAEGLLINASPPPNLLAVDHHPPSPSSGHEGIDVFEEWGDDRAAPTGKWGVGTQFSPIYSYRNLDVAGGSAANASYYDDVEEGIVSFAGGLNVHYAPLKRLSVQSGIYYSSMGMKVGNAYYADNADMDIYWEGATSMRASINNSTGIIETKQDLPYTYIANEVPRAGSELTGEYARVNTQDVPKGEILQQFEYLEVPLILRYRLIDRRLGFHFLGGLSSNFLVGNTAYYQGDGDRKEIGTTGNLRPVNYSSILGMGLDYSVSRKFHINLEPTFRYYLNPINTGSLIRSHPYSVGFFTGLMYTF
jgi:hypothetical protein